MSQFRLRQERAALFKSPDSYLKYYYLGGGRSSRLVFNETGLALDFRDREVPNSISDIDIIDEVVVQDTYCLSALKFARPVRVLDIGAHIGSFGWFASHLFDVSLLVAIEPEIENYRLLNRNLRQDNWPIGHAINGACGINLGDRLEFSSQNTGGHRFNVNQGHSTQNSKLVRLNELDKLGAGSHWEIIKVDVEGLEPNIVHEIVKEKLSFDYLLMELHNIGKGIDSVVELMRSIGKEVEFLKRIENSEGIFDIVRCS